MSGLEELVVVKKQQLESNQATISALDEVPSHIVATGTKVVEASIDYLQPEEYSENPKSLLEILFTLKGRIPRSTFWWVTGSYLLGVIILSSTLFISDNPLLPVLYLIFMAYAGVSIWAVGVKRFHDRNKCCWNMLIGVIPIIGPLYLFIQLGCMKGTTGANRFGQDRY